MKVVKKKKKKKYPAKTSGRGKVARARREMKRRGKNKIIIKKRMRIIHCQST